MHLLDLFKKVRIANEVLEASKIQNQRFRVLFEDGTRWAIVFRHFHIFEKFLKNEYGDWFYEEILKIDYKMGVEIYDINYKDPLGNIGIKKIIIGIISTKSNYN